MAYIRIWVHCVWGTKNRIAFFNDANTPIVIKHIKEKEIFIKGINIHKDHVHCLMSLRAGHTIDKDLQLLKGESSFWINKNDIVKGKFEWADEYFAVSVSESQVKKVVEYIENQEEHHKTKSFSDEYDEFMAKFGFESNS